MSRAERFSHDRYLVRQLIRPVVNVYAVHELGPDGTSPGPLVAFARQKRFAFKEDIRIFGDESEREEVFRIKARRRIDVGGRYDVTGSDGEPIGTLEKRFRASLIRSTWGVVNAQDHEVMWAREKSLPVAILRRVKEFVPYVGDYLPVPYHFVFMAGTIEIGGLRRLFTLRDQYLLDLSGDHGRMVDRRLGIALAIALDALQSR